MDTACVAYVLEPEREDLFRHMIHDEVDKWVNAPHYPHHPFYPLFPEISSNTLESKLLKNAGFTYNLSGMNLVSLVL